MAKINLDECTASFKLKSHYSAPKRLYTVTGTATHPEFGQVAILDGIKLTQRSAWKHSGDFLEIMDEDSDETMRFSTSIFDKDMNLLPWLVDGGPRSGTGCWGTELNNGDIVYIKAIIINEKVRRLGVGSWFLQQLLSSPDFKSSFIHFFCWPAPVGTDVDRSTLTDDNIAAFFQKNGFRRIGRTSYLCYSPDPKHASHAIALSDDATPLATAYGDTRGISHEQLASEFPLHVKVASVKTPEIVSLIRQAHAADPTSVHKKSLDGLTITHIAAATHNVHALRTLLELGVNDELADANNNMGMKPLEALQDSMRSGLVFSETFSVPWSGYSDEELICEYLLKKAAHIPGLPSSERAYIDQNKLGCTCGQCLGGWLSGRMRFLLSVDAIFTYDTGGMLLNLFSGAQTKETYLSQFSMEFVPPDIHHLVNKRFCKSWYQTFRVVHQMLEAKRIPFPAQVGLDPDVRPYVMQGGKVEYVLDSIISGGEAGYYDGDHAAIFGEQIARIPSCANDSKFALVRQKLGLDPRKRWGPYYDIKGEKEEIDEEEQDGDEIGDEEEEGDDDDDDDEDEEDFF